MTSSQVGLITLLKQIELGKQRASKTAEKTLLG
jgi:hypothetical protein